MVAGQCCPSTHQIDEREYGLGLGLNSIEWREAKHIAIVKYTFQASYVPLTNPDQNRFTKPGLD